MDLLKNPIARLLFNRNSGRHLPLENNPRSEGGYFLIVFAILSFVLVVGYLVGHRMPNVEKVEFSYFVEDVDQEISAQDALAKLNRGEFKKYSASKEVLDLGYMREGVWVLMKFSNRPESAASRYVLQLRHTYINGSFTPLDAAEKFDAQDSFRLGKTITFTDTILPRSQGLNDIRHVSFPVEVQPGNDFYALVRLRAHVMSVPFMLLAEREFLGSIVSEMVIISSFFGGLMLLALYNLMVGLARREKEFLFYGAYIFCMSMMIAAINGSGHMFIWPDVLWMHYNSANIFINLVCLSYIGFTLSVFKEARPVGLEKMLWNALFVMCLVGLVLQVVEGGFFASIEANLAGLAATCFSLVRAWRVRPIYGRIANLFLISECMLALGAFVYCIKMFGWLPSTPFTLNIVTVAATLEGILLSFVLSEKMRRTMNEKETALRNLAAAQQHLEASVRDKTLAIAARYTSHEVLNPVFAIRLKAERIRDEILSASENQDVSKFSISQQVLQKINEIFRLLDSIIHTIRAIKTLSNDGLREKVVAVELRSACEDALQLLEAKSFHLSCKVTIEISPDSVVDARRSDVVQVLMNLLSNSLDAVAGQDDQWIRITSRWIENPGADGGSIEVSVIDSGPGPHQDIRNKLFDAEISTKEVEVGMGLGLAFCQKLVSRNNGVIGYDNINKHTRFFFLLPATAVVKVPKADEIRKAS
jgi:signal transduction histidine kinase